MLPKKLKLLLSAAAIASLLTMTGCGKPDGALLNSALSVDNYTAYLTERIDNVNERSAAIIKTAHQRQLLNWKDKSLTGVIDYSPYLYKDSISELSIDSIIELANNSLSSSNFALNENEAAFIVQYLFSVLNNDGSQLHIPLSKLQKANIANVIPLLSKKITTPSVLLRVAVYEALSKDIVDWNDVVSITESEPKFKVLNKRARLMIEIKLVGRQLESSLSINTLNNFLENNMAIFDLDNPNHSLLPQINYSLLTKPYQVNRNKQKKLADNYLDFVILQDIPLLSDTAISLSVSENHS